MEKAPSYKASALKKSINMDIWVVGTTNQLFNIFKYLLKGATAVHLYSLFDESPFSNIYSLVCDNKMFRT